MKGAQKRGWSWGKALSTWAEFTTVFVGVIGFMCVWIVGPTLVVYLLTESLGWTVVALAVSVAFFVTLTIAAGWRKDAG